MGSQGAVVRQRSEAVNHRKTSSYTGRASALTKIERRAVMCGGLGNAPQHQPAEPRYRRLMS